MFSIHIIITAWLEKYAVLVQLWLWLNFHIYLRLNSILLCREIGIADPEPLLLKGNDLCTVLCMWLDLGQACFHTQLLTTIYCNLFAAGMDEVLIQWKTFVVHWLTMELLLRYCIAQTVADLAVHDQSTKVYLPIIFILADLLWKVANFLC